MQAVILAGGLGTRLRPLTDKVPKALVSVAGRPFLEWKLEQLRSNGVDDVVICVGYLGDLIEKHLGDGSSFGLKVRYSRDGTIPLGTIGAIKKAEKLLQQEFFVTYGDNYLRLDYEKMMSLLKSSGKLGVLAVYHNRNAFGRSDVQVSDGLVRAFKKGGQGAFEWINFGIYALRKSSLGQVAEGEPFDEHEFFDLLIGKGELLSYEVSERFYEIGSKESLAEFERFIADKKQR
jgi:N-acetyl-alpha-D-muramate 1-phosphate uridylyltransferase